MDIRSVFERMAPVLLRLFQATGNPDVYRMCLTIQDTLKHYDYLSKEEVEKRVIQLKDISQAL